jgi:hypothetical protein
MGEKESFYYEGEKEFREGQKDIWTLKFRVIKKNCLTSGEFF